MRPTFLFAIAIGIASLSACITPPKLKEMKAERAAIEDEYTQVLEEMRVRQREAPVPAHKAIEISDFQRLMDSELRASYVGLGVRDAISQIVLGYPVIFDYSDDYRPTVSTSPRATTVGEHLDSISVQANLGITLRNGVVLVTDSVTRDYSVPSFGNANQQSTGATYSVSSNNLAGSSTSGGFTNISQFRFNAYTELKGLVESITGLSACRPNQINDTPRRSNGLTSYTPGIVNSECYSISGSANLLTLTSSPRKLAAFEEAYDAWTTSINRSAEVTLKIVEFSVTETIQQSFDFSLIRNGKIITSLDATTKGLVDIKEGAGVLRFNFFEGNRFDGSQIIIEALDAVGDVSSVETKEFQVMNNRLLTLRDFTNERFLKEITIQDTSSGNTSLSTPTIEQGEIPVGTAVNILPTITEDGISLHVVYNEASLDRLVPFTVGDSISGITPIDSGSDNVFDVSLISGETVLLSSSNRREVSTKDEAPAAMPSLQLSRTKEGEKRVTQTLFIISARII